MKNLILTILIFSSVFSFGQIKINNNTVSIDASGNITTNGYVSAGSRVIVNRVIVGTKGHYTDLKTACEVAYTSPTEILIDGGTFNITNTITINNPNVIAIRGIGSGGTILKASTGLTNKPFFTVTTDLYVDKLTIDGSTLASYGTLSTENCFDISGANAYVDFQNAIITGFYDQFNFTGAGTSSFIFNSIFNDAVNSSIKVNTTGVNAIDVETNTFDNCKRAFYLVKSSDGNFDIVNNFFENPSNETAIVYVPDAGNYILHSHNSITNNKWNNVGSFYTGFDFTLASGRDANIYVQNNYGKEDKNPHGKINVLNNASTTTVTTAGTFYKAVFTNTSSYKCKLTIANNRVTYQPLNVRDMIMNISANVISSSNSRNIDIAIVKNGNTALGLFGQMTARCETANQAYAVSTNVYLEDVAPTDYFEIWLTASNNGNTVIIQDVSWFIDTK